MPTDSSISSSVDLAAGSWTLPRSSSSAAIPDNETFHQALESASSKSTDTPEKILGVAKQFEALMVGQILKSAREASGGGWLSDEDSQDDQTGSLVMEMAEQGFSQAIAARGGLGIAKMVTAQIERGEVKNAGGEAKTPSSDSAPPPTPPSSKNTTMSQVPHTDVQRPAPLAARPHSAPPLQQLQRPQR
jgi:Rod binding domain-containing protein